MDTLEVDGRSRSYVCHLPPDTTRPLPLLIVLHGRRSTPAEMQWMTHFDAIADRHGFAAVYPEGYDRSWNDGRGTTPAERAGVDDVSFIRRLIEHLAEQTDIDPARIGVTGLSNGGVMCHRLGLELSDRISAIAPVAGPMPVALASATPEYAVSVFLIHGTADRFMPLQGGRSRGLHRALLSLVLSDARRHGGGVLSVADTAACWRAIDGCERETILDALPASADDPTSVERVRFSGGRGGTEVECWMVQGGGHTWPGGPPFMGLGWLGRTSRHFDASPEIWRFISSHWRRVLDRRVG